MCWLLIVAGVLLRLRSGHALRDAGAAARAVVRAALAQCAAPGTQIQRETATQPIQYNSLISVLKKTSSLLFQCS